MSADGKWVRREANGVSFFELAGFPSLSIAFVARGGGVSRDVWRTLNLSFDVGDRDYHVRENWDRVRTALRLPSIITMRQTHSDTVVPIAYDKTPQDVLEGDASFTGLPGVGLGIRVADCLPVYIFPVDGRCAGIAHCGWRGTADRIAEKTARLMARRFSVPLSSLCFALGPTICPACYPVGEDVVRTFSDRFPAGDKFLVPNRPSRGRGQFLLDIRAANRWLLAETGLSEAGSLDLCTAENPTDFYSARREGQTGRNLAVVSLRTPDSDGP